jgi:hypothetical protein
MTWVRGGAIGLGYVGGSVVNTRRSGGSILEKHIVYSVKMISRYAPIQLRAPEIAYNLGITLIRWTVDILWLGTDYLVCM